MFGLRSEFLSFVRFFFARFGVRIEISKCQKVRSKLFRNRTLRYDSAGFWTVDPPVTGSELDEFYRTDYWTSRGGKTHGTIIRDHLHLEFLYAHIGDFLSNPKTVLNFGAGHGGISHLMWLRGHNVINVEPSGLPEFYSERWTTFQYLQEVPDQSIDLVYGSHSLEHVANIRDFLQLLQSKIRDRSFVFWEVPNADAKGNGPLEGKIEVPHTYYFQKLFFDGEFSKLIVNDTFKSRAEVSDWEFSKRIDGNVIRVIGAYDIPVGET
jgi:hypothetical protein